MRNVTITLDEETARLARLEAARRDTSVSRLVGEMLRDHLAELDDYDRRERSWRARDARALKTSGGRYPTRDELHER
ncbi:MAG: CopG family transcriptional regulator [Acidimicrobiales bacterium]